MAIDRAEGDDMKRPAFQFYTGDWKRNANLRRCTFAERGIWIEVMCLLHDSDEYGVLRWPFEEIATAVGCRVADLQALRRKGVLKGADAGEDFPGYQVRPRHAGRQGHPVEIVPPQPGPLWFSSRMVWDEHKRQNSGGETRIKDGVPPSAPTPSPSPSPRHGGGDGDGAAVASSSSSSKHKKARKRADLTPLPEGFAVSERVRVWAKEKGYGLVDLHFEAFLVNVRANGNYYADWDAALMKAIAKDYADLRKGRGPGGNVHPIVSKWRPGGEPADVLKRVARELQLEPWQDGETQGQFRQRIVEAGGEALLAPPKVA